MNYKNFSSNFPSVGDLVLVLFYNEGMRRGFYIGSCCRVSKLKNRNFKLTFIRAKDRSCLSFEFSSPTILGFKVLKKAKK